MKLLSSFWAMLLIFVVGASTVPDQLSAAGAEGPFTYIFDTGTSSSAPLSGEALSKKTGWTQLPEDKTVHTFRGDTVFLNDKLAIVLRRNATGAEIYSNSAAGLKKRAQLLPMNGTADLRLLSVRIIENNTSTVSVDAFFGAKNHSNCCLRYELQIGQSFVKTESRRGVKRLRVGGACRFVVLPDFFADDIVIDARQFPVDRGELPSENFIMHMLDDGEAVLMGVWDKRGNDVRITLSDRAGQRAITGSEIPYSKDGKIWIAVMADKDIWYMRDVKKKDADREISLAWRQPFPALWRVDWQKAEGDIDSWEMLTQGSNGGYIKHSWFGQKESLGTPDWMKPDRRRWTTVLGRFQYPCWINKNGMGYLQPLKKKLRFEGPALIYPINRLKETPIDKITVVDIVRGTLGVGPCEYILDVEGQQKKSAGIATCAARNLLNPIYEKKQQKHKKAVIKKGLVDVLAFIQHIRDRIEDYVAFGHKMQAYLAERKKNHPELAEPIAEMETITRKIDTYMKSRKNAINTPAHAVRLVGKFRTKLINYEGADAFKKCKEITAGLVKIGGNQDELVGECRMAVKILRQRAGIIMATDPRMKDIAREVRHRTQEILRNPVSYEAPRH